MSVIKTETDRKGKTVTYATGIIDFVKLDKFAEPKTFHWDGKAIVSTHRASIAIKEKGAKPEEKGIWIGLGDIELKEGYENLQVKVDDKYITLVKGVEVSIDIDKVDKKGDKVYYNTKKSRISVISTEGAIHTPQKGAGSDSKATSQKPRDNTGQLVGHAVGGAATLRERGNEGDLIDLAKLFHEATSEAKDIIAKESTLNEYELGAGVGNAINSAAKIVDINSDGLKGELVNVAIDIYRNVSVPMHDFIKSGTKTTELPKVEKKKESEPVKSEEPPMDFDSDIPF